MSAIYHIVQFEDGSAYLMFDVCDWRCSYKFVSKKALTLREEMNCELLC